MAEAKKRCASAPYKLLSVFSLSRMRERKLILIKIKRLPGQTHQTSTRLVLGTASLLLSLAAVLRRSEPSGTQCQRPSPRVLCPPQGGSGTLCAALPAPLASASTQQASVPLLSPPFCLRQVMRAYGEKRVRP